MPRLPRYFLRGAPLHIVQRGNNRGAIFAEPRDRAFFYAQLSEAATKRDVAIHAYVLMSNHIHLLVTPGSAAGVPKMMQDIGRNYVPWFNTQYKRTGGLWQGRYRAAIVESDRHLLACMRYVELNPVRAAVVEAPAAYRWSSFRGNALGEPDDLISPHAVYEALGGTPSDRQRAYRALFDDAIPVAELNAIRDGTQHAWAIGGATFQAQLLASGRRPTRNPRGRPRR